MILQNEQDTHYHANPAWGSSEARVFRRSPQESMDERNGLKQRIDKGCFQIGRMVHMMVLEPERFAKQVVDHGPINPKTGSQYGRDTKAWREWAELNPDKVVVEPWIRTMLQRMPTEIKAIFRSGLAETTVRVDADDTYPMMQCRPDWQNGTLSKVWDLKTIDRLERIDKNMSSHGYYLQQGWYELCIERETGKRPQSFTFIFCEKFSPWRWQIVELEDDYREEGYIQAIELAKDIRDAEAVNDFTDHTDLYRTVSMPHWMGQITENPDGSISL